MYTRFFLWSVLISHSALALDWNAKTEIQAIEYYRDIGGNISAYEGVLTQYLSANSLFKANLAPNLVFEAQPEFRFLFGNRGGGNALDPAYLSVSSPSRLTDLSESLFSYEDSQGEYDTQRLALDFQSGEFQLTVGRRPFSLGILKVFSVWNKFSRPLPVVQGPSLVYGVDSIVARAQWSPWSVEVFTILGAATSDHVGALHVSRNWQGLEVHALAARWWQQGVLGLGSTIDWVGAAWKLECLKVGLLSDDTEKQLQCGLGFERALGDKWIILAESLYQSKGQSDKSQYTLSTPGRFNSFRGVFYGFFQGQIKLTEYWTFSLGTLINLLDPSTYEILKAQYSMYEWVDLFAELDFPLGASGGEFSRHSINGPGGTYYGAPIQVSIGAKATF